jgi:AcrR family transcriptional regulator
MKKLSHPAKLNSPRTAPAKDSRSPYHHGDLKHALLEASLEILNNQGEHALSLRAAAKRAGVSPAAPYRHFTNKEALLAAIAAHGFQNIACTLQAIARRYPADFEQQLLAAAEAYIALACSQPAMVRVMFTCCQSQHAETVVAYQAAESALSTIFQQGQAAGLFAPHPVEDMVTLAFAFIHGLALLVTDHSGATGIQQDIPTLVRNLCKLLFSGLSKRP